MNRKTLVVGLGNPILTDDGVGVMVVEQVEDALGADVNGNIDLTEASVGGLRLMELMIGYDRVILIDAIVSSNGIKPGTIRQMSLDDLREISPTHHSSCAHDTSLVTALELGKKMDLHLPEQISIYAIEVENVRDFSDRPTAAVAEAIPRATALVLDDLRLN